MLTANPTNRLTNGLAVLALSVLLVCSQLAGFAHAEADCEHEACCLCVGSGLDSANVDSASPNITFASKKQLQPADSTTSDIACEPTADFIRGPPAI